MKFTKRKLIPVLVSILLIASILRLLKLTILTSSDPSLVHRQQKCSSSSSICGNKISPSNANANTNASVLTEKETRFLLDLVSKRIPCKLLVFGLEPQYSSLASLNDAGFTVFIEDNPEKISTVKVTNKTRVHKVEYKTIASDAFELLKHARENPDCAPKFHRPKSSRCKLARLTNLPREVYSTKWDVVVVDGPRGDVADSPGRMAAIYTASILARKGNATDVLVHDVDRMIEKWFSWEFLCDKNLVSSKGRFWNFRILREPNATTFCTV